MEISLVDCEKYLPDRVLELICAFHHRKCKDCEKLLRNEDFNKHYDYDIAKYLKKKYSRNGLQFSIKHQFQCFDCFKNPTFLGKKEGKGYRCYSYAFNFRGKEELQEGDY